jgi:hypothetical protein
MMPAPDVSLINASATNNSGGLPGQFPKYIFIGTSDVTVVNTLTETSLTPASFVGTDTIPGNYLYPGDKIKVFAQGVLSATLTPNLTLKLYYGATVISTATVAVGAIAAGTRWSYEGMVIVRKQGATGQVMAGQIMWFDSTVQTGISVAPAAVTIDTTAAGQISCKVTWGTAAAGNTITSNNISIEVVG